MHQRLEHRLFSRSPRSSRAKLKFYSAAFAAPAADLAG
jgi:hypothetical protein